MAYNDPFSPEGFQDPILGGMTGGGAPPAVDPTAAAAQAAALQQPVSGAQMPPLLEPPTLSEKLINLAIGMANADQAGLGLGGSIAYGLKGYADTIDENNAKNRQARMDKLAEYELMGRIRDRHLTELAMQQKLNAGTKFKAAYPEMADLYDADPAAAAKAIIDKTAGKAEFKEMGGVLYKLEPGKDPVPYNQNGMPAATSSVNNSDLTGDEYLKTIDPAMQRKVVALAEGRIELPSPRSASYKPMLDAVTQYQPGFDASTAKLRVATRKDFSVGQAAKSVNSLQTAIGHGADLLSQIDNLKNQGGYMGSSVYNYVANAAEKSGGDTGPSINAFDTTRDNFVDEVSKVYNPAGGSASERDERKKTLADHLPPEQLREGVKKQVELMMSKLDALDSQYKQGLNPDAKKYEFLSPHARENLVKIGVLDPEDLGNVAPPDPAQDAADATAPTAAPTAAAAPAGPTQAQLEYTAKKYGITVDQVKQKLGIQ